MSEVLIAEGLKGREGDEDPGSRPTVNRWKVELDLAVDNDERGEDRGDAKTWPFV